MKIICLNQGKFQENTYICCQEKEALIIDPGNPLSLILEHLKDCPRINIYLTHGHSDHTMAVDDLCDIYPDSKIFMHHGDEDLISPHSHLAFGLAIYHPIEYVQEGPLQIGSFMTKVYYTPGHSKGSSCLQIKDCLFTGDTLFKGTVGRSDLYGGNEQELFMSLHKLKKLDHSLKIYPGHDQCSTLANEIATNYFLR